jgi:hypothetical protein
LSFANSFVAVMVGSGAVERLLSSGVGKRL